MTEETAMDIEKRLIALLARLDVLCPQHYKEIERNAHDTDQAFSKIRKTETDLKDVVAELKTLMVEQAKDYQKQIHTIQVQQAKRDYVFTIVQTVLLAGLVKIIVG